MLVNKNNQISSTIAFVNILHVNNINVLTINYNPRQKELGRL